MAAAWARREGLDTRPEVADAAEYAARQLEYLGLVDGEMADDLGVSFMAAWFAGRKDGGGK